MTNSAVRNSFVRFCGLYHVCKLSLWRCEKCLNNSVDRLLYLDVNLSLSLSLLHKLYLNIFILAIFVCLKNVCMYVLAFVCIRTEVSLNLCRVFQLLQRTFARV